MGRIRTSSRYVISMIVTDSLSLGVFWGISSGFASLVVPDVLGR